jgi:hypothetical protein
LPLAVGSFRNNLEVQLRFHDRAKPHSDHIVVVANKDAGHVAPPPNVGRSNQAKVSVLPAALFTEFKATDDHSRRTDVCAKAQALTQSGKTLIAEEMYPIATSISR